ncbi:MAG TPA: hypothetical protein V6D18_17150 [Thermosynechococcaceae cyanobacterium]
MAASILLSFSGDREYDRASSDHVFGKYRKSLQESLSFSHLFSARIMSVDLCWYLYRVRPKEAPEMRKAFKKAIKQSQIAEETKAFLQAWPETPEDGAEWERWFSAAYKVLYPDAFTKLLESVVAGQTILQANSNSLEFVCTNRIGAAMMLCEGLGFARARRLPGYFGNLFIPPEETASALEQVKQIFSEVTSTEFVERAAAIGSYGDNDRQAKELAILLPLQLQRVSYEGDGLLALSHPCVGAIPYPEGGEEYDEY